MKKYIYSVLIALIAISCSQSDDFNNSYVDISPTNIPQTLYAEIPDVESRAIEQFVDQPMSWDKTASNESRTVAVHDTKNTSEYYQYWSVGDEISLFLTTHNLKYGLINTTEPDRGTFTLQSDAIASSELLGDYYYSVYPYKEDTKISQEGVVTFTFPEIQYYNVDSYANGINGMIAREPKEQTDSLLEFKNFCSYLQINLYHPYEDETINRTSNIVEKITLKSNNENVKISGVGDISYNGDTPVVTMRNNELSRRAITLYCGDEGVELSENKDEPTKFWFVLPGNINFNGGFTITVTFDDGTNFRQNTDNTFGIVRNHIKPMVAVSTVNNVPEGSLRYKLRDPNAGPYPIGTEFYDEDTQLEIISHVKDETTGEWVVNFGGELNWIGGYNFESTEPEIEYIKINNNAPITLDENTFNNCNADYIEIFNDVNTIKTDAFINCNIGNINIYGDIDLIEGYIISSDANIDNVNIYGKVNILEKNAFSNSDIKSIFIEDEITSIENYAFLNCQMLENVYLPKLKDIGKGAFRDCTALKIIKLESVENIGDNAFYNCTSLAYIEISAQCKNIGNSAFCYCQNLTTVYCYAINPPQLKKSSKAFHTECPNTTIYIPMGTKESYVNQTYWLNYADILSEM